MAKDKTTNPYEEMMSLLSDEDRAALAEMTGQAATGGSSNKTPIIKINYKERADVNKKKIAKGNFVLGQQNGTVDGKKVLVEAGTDLGNELDVVILKTGTQYSYWSEDIKKRCSSQVICERGEVPKGFNLKNVCNDKSCPRRKDGVDKTEKCVNQFVVYVRLPQGTKLPDGTDCPIAMLYIKGQSYKPYQEYLNEDLKGIPSIAVTTKLATTEEEQGATLYFVLGFEKGAPVPTAVFKENFELVSGVNKQLLEYKTEQQKKLIAAKPESSTNAGTGSDPIVINGSGEDEIPW